MPKFTENCWRIALPFWKRPHPVFHQEILSFPESRTTFRSNLGSWEYTFRPRFWIKKSTERSVATSRFRISFRWDTRTGSYCNVHTNCFNCKVGKKAILIRPTLWLVQPRDHNITTSSYVFLKPGYRLHMGLWECYTKEYRLHTGLWETKQTIWPQLFNRWITLFTE